MEKRNLVICRAGDNSLHKQWINPPGNKNFTLLIDYYGNEHNKFVNDADIYIESHGVKWSRIFSIIQSMQEDIFQYDAVWFPDDDLSTNSSNIRDMFNIFHTYNLNLAQPALTNNSYFSHYVTILNNKLTLRYTNFVEVMAPIFSKEALKSCWHTFNQSETGWGLDLLWPKLLKNQGIAIIDATPVIHTRPVGGGEIYKAVKTPVEDQIQKMRKTHDIKGPLILRTFSGIDKNGNLIESKFEMAVKLLTGTPTNIILKKGFRKRYLYKNIVKFMTSKSMNDK